MPVNSCTLCGFRQERQRELQLGSGCAGHDARLRGHDDAVVPKVLYKAECWRTKSNTFHNKTNCLSTIYEQNEIYNLS